MPERILHFIEVLWNAFFPTQPELEHPELTPQQRAASKAFGMSRERVVHHPVAAGKMRITKGKIWQSPPKGKKAGR